MRPLGEGTYRFGGVEVDAARACVTRDGVELMLRPRPFRVLLYLVENPQRVVTKDELIEQVWEGTAVTDDALVKCIGDIRKALGDDPRNPRFVKTVSKGGYRFIGSFDGDGAAAGFALVEVDEVTTVEVEYDEDSTPPADALAASAPARSTVRRVAAVAVVAVALAASTALVVPRLGRSSDERAAADVTLPRVPGKTSVAVMFFENQSSDPQLEWLREGLADMLITSLSDSDGVTVLSRDRLRLLLDRAGRGDARAVGLDDALDVARRSQAETVVLGSFGSLGGKVRVDVRLHDGGDGRLLASESLVVDDPGELLTRIDLLSLKIAARLGTPRGGADSPRPLSEVMTADLEAYRDYSLALERAQGLQNAEAIALLERALAVDPGFAMARARIGYVYCMKWGYPEKARPYLEEAYRHPDRLTDKDRLYIAAWYAVANADFEGAIQAFRVVLARYPLETEAYVSLARLLNREARSAEAVEAAERGMAVDAESGALANTLGSAYLGLGRREEAVAAYRRYVELEPREPNAYDSLGLAYQWFGDYDAAVAEYGRALEIDPGFEIALVHLGNAYAQTGRYREAISCYSRYGEIGPSDGERSRAQVCLAYQYFKLGDRARSHAAARKAVALSSANALTELEIAVLEGNVAAAERASARVGDALPDRGGRLTDRLRLYLLGRLAFEQGRLDEAIERFREAVRQPAPIWNHDSFEDCLANALLEAGRLDEAIAEYERILGVNGNYPLARFHLAEALERKNDAEGAAREYRRFLDAWPHADADVPEVAAARERLARLGPGSM
jgi:tetratricopeptide (TPR) repeat protein/DNA-binding winged helix-turn-helix (wHTH) protein